MDVGADGPFLLTSPKHPGSLCSIGRKAKHLKDQFELLVTYEAIHPRSISIYKEGQWKGFIFPFYELVSTGRILGTRMRSFVDMCGWEEGENLEQVSLPS